MRASGEDPEGDLACWRDALDTFREGLGVARAALDQGVVPTAPSWPPTRLPTGALPPQLRAEAEALMVRSDQLTKELLGAMDGIAVDRGAKNRRVTFATGSSNHARWSVRM